MGLTIHYSGSFNPQASLTEMINEVKDIAEIYKWEYTVFEEAFPETGFGKTEYDQNIYGIAFSPPRCEAVWLSFLSNGKMSGPSQLMFFGNSENKDYQKYLYMLFTKTQYAGVEIHKLVIHILKYISGKYLRDFKVIDEGHYWETGDEKLLQDTFKRYSDLIESFASSVENYPRKPGESFETYFARLIKQVQDKNKK
jgi:hypothetical protein